jgi:hypothetical protein
MPYEFTDEEYELEPQPSSARSGGPPRKSTGIGLLDEPFPPKGPIEPLRRLSAVLWMRILAILLLLGIGISVLYPFFSSHK